MTLHNFSIHPRKPHPTWHRAIENRCAVRHIITSSLLALALFASNGCFSLKPAGGTEHYYLLTSASSSLSSPANVRAAVVRLLPVEVPDYLQTKDMVLRTGTNEMIFATYHQWAESLDAGIRRVLAESLRTSPSIREVLTDEPAPPDTKPYIISIHILACEGDTTYGRHSILFKARWEIVQSDVSLAHGIFTAEPTSWRPNDYSDLAMQLSRAVHDLARVLNEKISSQATHHSGRALEDKNHSL